MGKYTQTYVLKMDTLFVSYAVLKSLSPILMFSTGLLYNYTNQEKQPHTVFTQIHTVHVYFTLTKEQFQEKDKIPHRKHFFQFQIFANQKEVQMYTVLCT